MDSVRVSGRFRLAPLLEWVIAVAFLAATVFVATVIVQGLQAPRHVRVTTPAARPVVASIPPAVPARAVSVPVLPFIDGQEVRVGETFAAIASRLGRSAEVGRQEVDRGTVGERLTRFYEYAGTKFVLVFEPFEQHGEPRVAAIYLP